MPSFLFDAKEGFAEDVTTIEKGDVTGVEELEGDVVGNKVVGIGVVIGDGVVVWNGVEVDEVDGNGVVIGIVDGKFVVLGKGVEKGVVTGEEGKEIEELVDGKVVDTKLCGVEGKVDEDIGKGVVIFGVLGNEGEAEDVTITVGVRVGDKFVVVIWGTGVDISVWGEGVLIPEGIIWFVTNEVVFLIEENAFELENKELKNAPSKTGGKGFLIRGCRSLPDKIRGNCVVDTIIVELMKIGDLLGVKLETLIGLAFISVLSASSEFLSSSGSGIWVDVGGTSFISFITLKVVENVLGVVISDWSEKSKGIWVVVITFVWKLSKLLSEDINGLSILVMKSLFGILFMILSPIRDCDSESGYSGLCRSIKASTREKSFGEEVCAWTGFEVKISSKLWMFLSLFSWLENAPWPLVGLINISFEDFTASWENITGEEVSPLKNGSSEEGISIGAIWISSTIGGKLDKLEKLFSFCSGTKLLFSGGPKPNINVWFIMLNKWSVLGSAPLRLLK